MRTIRGIVKDVTRRKGRVGLAWLKTGNSLRGTSRAAGVQAGLYQDVINANSGTKTT